MCLKSEVISRNSKILIKQASSILKSYKCRISSNSICRENRGKTVGVQNIEGKALADNFNVKL